jgi:hypothetical protein
LNCRCHCLQFTSEHYLIEGAKEVAAAGGDSFKFHLANLDARGNAISVSGQRVSSLVCCSSKQHLQQCGTAISVSATGVGAAFMLQQQAALAVRQCHISD